MAKEIKKNSNITRDWYQNKYQIVLIQKNLFSLFTIFALIAVVIAVFFVKKMTESKSFEPFVIEMEDKTGNIQVVENLTTTKMTADETLKRYFIYNFLKVAEGYNFATYKDDITKLGLFSSSSVYRQILPKIYAKNPNSPINRLGNNGIMTVGIKSVVALTPESVSVRFVVKNTRPDANIPAQKHLVAYIEYKFLNLNLTEAERFINPLGFQVIKYRVDKDLIQ